MASLAKVPRRLQERRPLARSHCRGERSPTRLSRHQRTCTAASQRGAFQHLQAIRRRRSSDQHVWRLPTGVDCYRPAAVGNSSVVGIAPRHPDRWDGTAAPAASSRGGILRRLGERNSTNAGFHNMKSLDAILLCYESLRRTCREQQRHSLVSFVVTADRTKLRQAIIFRNLYLLGFSDLEHDICSAEKRLNRRCRENKG